MKKTFISTLICITGICCSCSGALSKGEVDLDYDKEKEEEEEKKPEKEEEKDPYVLTLNHPCAYVNAENIARVKAAVAGASATDPVYASWQSFCKSPYAAASYTASPVPTVVRGDATGTGTTENYIVCDRDAAAAFQLALRYRISEDRSYADAAVRILNAWAKTCKKITANDNNQYLLVGFQGYTFANAAELLRDYDGWAAADQNSFKTWLNDLWYTKSYWFISTHGGSGTCNLHYWSNWELANLCCQLAIGIYLDDAAKIKYVYNEFTKGAGSGAINNMIPYPPVADPDGKSHLIAQNMESGRDQGHATLVISLCAELCQMAENVGLGFWGMQDNKVLAMAEYTAKYNVKPDGRYLAMKEMPFTTYKYCTDCACSNHSHGATHTTISIDSRGKERACWDLIYAHYVKVKKLPENYAYYSKMFAEQLRYNKGVLTGDGGAGDERYGSTSAAYDQLGWGTMLFYQGN